MVIYIFIINVLRSVRSLFRSNNRVIAAEEDLISPIVFATVALSFIRGGAIKNATRLDKIKTSRGKEERYVFFWVLVEIYP